MPEIVYENLEGQVYADFIAEAVKRSDILTYAVGWPSEEFFLDLQEDYIKDFVKAGRTEQFARYIYNEKKNEFLEEKNIFEKNCRPFLELLERFHVNGQKLLKSKSVYHLKADEEIIPFLLEVKSFENWNYPYYPCDLRFAKEDKYWFESETHGMTFAYIYPESESDYDFWTKQGIVFIEPFDYSMDVLNRPPVKPF